MQAPVHITYIGHATCLITGGGEAILTDPCFSRRLFWWRRRQPLRADPGALPPLSAIVISHAHYDHCDCESFKYIPGRVPVIVPPGMAGAIHPFVNNPILELAHWVPHALADGVTITPVPVRHRGGRLVPGLRYRQVSGYLIALHGQHIYFAGDTRYGTHFREVGQMYPIDVACLPIGGFLPPRYSLQRPMNGLETLQAFLDLKARHMIPVHWGAFGCARGWTGPLAQLQRHAADRQLADRVHQVEPGAEWTLPVVDGRLSASGA